MDFCLFVGFCHAAQAGLKCVCSSDWPQTHDPPALVSSVLGLQTDTTTRPSFATDFCPFTYLVPSSFVSCNMISVDSFGFSAY